MGETVRGGRAKLPFKWRAVSAVGAGALLFGGLAGCGTRFAPECYSSEAESQWFDPDPAATSDPSTWKNAVEATTTNIPDDASDVVVSFYTPGAPKWEESDPVDADLAESLALKVGNEAVRFRLKFAGNVGSDACSTLTLPETVYEGLHPSQLLIDRGATAPRWSE